jgi:hypothetical protein
MFLPLARGLAVTEYRFHLNKELAQKSESAERGMSLVQSPALPSFAYLFEESRVTALSHHPTFELLSSQKQQQASTLLSQPTCEFLCNVESKSFAPRKSSWTTNTAKLIGLKPLMS